MAPLQRVNKHMVWVSSGGCGCIGTLGSSGLKRAEAEQYIDALITFVERLAEIGCYEEGQSLCVCMHVCVLSRFSHVQLFATPWIVAHQAPLSMDSPGKDAGMGSHSLLQGILLTQRLNPRLVVS